MSLQVRIVFAVLMLAAVQPSARPQAATPTAGDALEAGFRSPPASARLRCYWWWLNGNTTEATITRDLTQMSRKGFGGVLLVDANGSNQNGNDNVPPGPTFGSPEWMRLYLHALKTAAGLHLEVTLNITSGWNLGGPDVTPEQASKLLTWSRQIIDGNSTDFSGDLPMPEVKNGFYRQIAVLAYPLQHGPALAGEAESQRPAIRQLLVKSAAAEMSFSMPRTEPLLDDAPASPGEEDATLSSVLDLTTQVGDSGHLTWKPPSPGTWEILRIGYTDSGARVSTSSGAWQGLAIDYLDRGAFDTYWDHTVEPLLAVAKPYWKTTLVSLATDSWELGGTNWTGRFANEFRARRGYDPIRYLPIVAGRILSDRATSDLFLNDLRRTVGDLVTDHYDHFAERARAHGLGIECESGGPHGAPFDALETFRSATVPQTEYWAQSNEHRSRDEDRFFTKEAASAANIYGKPLAAQEGMTSIGPQWSESLATDLKPSFDQALTEGMNRFVWHEFTSSPAEFGLPGNEYFAGTHLNPNVTWWDQGNAFFTYLNRAQYLLQQGRAVDDVLYFYGDQVPNFVRLKSDDPAHVLPGYDYDVTNQDALLHSLTIRDGALVTPAGNPYRLLVMPQGRRLSLASLERIAGFVHQGGIVAGEPPLAPIGIMDAESSSRFNTLLQAVWGGCSAGPHTYGSGRVFCTADTRAILKELNVPPDFSVDSAKLDYIHRYADGVNIYFVRNPSAAVVDTFVRLRVVGREPEVWNPVDGTIVRELNYDVVDGVTRMPVHLAPFGSAFLVFRRPAGLHALRVEQKAGAEEPTEVVSNTDSAWTMSSNEPGTYRLILSDGTTRTITVASAQTVDLPPARWTIRFQPDRGAPSGTQTLRSFTSWSESEDPGIRYFSGSAWYATQVDFHPEAGQHMLLRLTDLYEICTIMVNGREAGTLWARPFEFDLTGWLKEGANTLELRVTNLWPNRIIGDSQPDASRKYTRTNIRKYTAGFPLLPSGLVGPVTLTTTHDAAVTVTSPSP